MNIIELIHKGIMDFNAVTASNVTRIFINMATSTMITNDSQNRFIYGDPPSNPFPRLWGIPVVICEHIPDNVAELRDDLTGQVIQIECASNHHD